MLVQLGIFKSCPTEHYVKRAVLEDTAPGVKTARKVNTVMVLIQLPRHVAIAPPVITTTTRAKDRVCHAVPVNSTMLQVLLVANYVSTQPTLVTKEEKAVALIVPRVGLPKTAVQNVLRAVRVRLALGVKSVHWGFPEKGTIQMRLNANNVNWVKQQRLKVPLNAMIVMPEDLATPKEIVRHAPLVFIKPRKVKQHASNATWEKCTSMLKQSAANATKVHLVARMAFARHARLDIFKIPQAKTNAVPLVSRLEKYPT
jgi:hypothetical protein